MVLQLLPTISYGDAVSNDTLALEKVIQKMGYKTGIYADSIDVRFPKGTAKERRKMPKLKPEDVVIYHMSTGSQLNWDFGRLDCRKVMVYHNVTPPGFVEKYNTLAAKQCSDGLEAARWLSDKVDYCLAVSEYNKQDLESMGYRCKIDVLPILIPFEDYAKKPDEVIVRKYQDGYTNILFTGRLAPNKCQEDVIRSFAFYQKYYNPKSRLFLVGSDGGYENYRKRLESLVNVLGVQDVIFTGHIRFAEILAYYQAADVFLCQSEHEGFCVPLVEAMYFQIPVIAYDSTAIYDTLGGGSIIMKEKNAVETAGMIDRLVKDENLRRKVIENQQKRLRDFDHREIEARFAALMKENVLGGQTNPMKS